MIIKIGFPVIPFLLYYFHYNPAPSYFYYLPDIILFKIV